MLTKNEFIEFVNSFGKRPGEFTKDEIFEIGLKHKEIEPQTDRSWDLVKELVGWAGSSNSLRMSINDRLKREQGTPKVETLSPFQEEVNRLYIEKTKVRDVHNAVNRGLRDQARIEVLKETIQEVAKALPQLPEFKSPVNVKDGTREAILMLSDLHLGAYCKNFYNEYNIEIAAMRLDKLADDTINYCKKFNIYKLNVVNLGDMIHGIIHTSLRIDSQTDAVTEVMLASELVSKFLNKIRLAAPVITYRSCSDNHSRTFSDKMEAIENENLGRLIDWFLKERLCNTEIEFSDDNIDYSIGKFTLLNGKKVMFAHGHNDSINRSFEAFVGASREFIDYGLLAHYHCSKMKDFQGFKIFVNGSIIGTEQYALSRRLFSKPSQTLLVFDNDNVINFNIDLSLD